MATDEWTSPTRSEPSESTDGSETVVDERGSTDGPELPDHETRPPARTSSTSPAAPQTDDDADDAPDEEPEPLVSRPATMAILSHMSVLFGVPVFLVPLVQRRHALSLHHAKAAAIIWFFFYAALALSLFVSGLFTPVMLLLYLPALAGIHRAVQGREAGRWGAGDLAERLFPFPKADEH